MKRCYRFENSAKSVFNMNPDRFTVPPYSKA